MLFQKQQLQQQAVHQQQQFNLQQKQLQQTQNLILVLLQKNSKGQESKTLFELSYLFVRNYSVGLILNKKKIGFYKIIYIILCQIL